MSENKNLKSLITLVIISMFSALSIILYFFEFPVLQALPHLKLDFSDIPALLAGVAFGPLWGAAVELIKNVVEMIFKGLGTQMGYGNLMNFIVGCAFVCPFSYFFRKFGEKYGFTKKVIFSSIVGIISIVGLGIAANYLIAPLFFKHFMGIELTNDALWAAVWGATALNAIKGVMLAVAAILILKPVLEAISKNIRGIAKNE